MKNRQQNRKVNVRPITIAAAASFTLLLILFGILILSGNQNGDKSVETENIERTEIVSESENSIVIKTDDNEDAVLSEIEETESVKSESGGLEADDNEIPDATYIEEADHILNEMTLDEKIYQMMILMPEQLTEGETVTAVSDNTRDILKRYPIGGIMYMAGNLKNPEQTKKMLSDMQEIAQDIEGLPLFMCVDEEGGRVSRIGNNSSFGVDKVKAMSEIKSAEEAYDAGNTIGNYLSDLGFNVDFAPDSDVLTNSDNIVIGDRSFGGDADLVKEYSRAYSDGLHANGILSTYKHFPGHGTTAGDTHEGFAYTNKTIEELESNELIPFMDAQNAGADMVMVSHISIPKILEDDTPCSLSYHMITDILKDELEYEGIIVTDAMNMGAITGTYNGVDASLQAIKAGNDMILAPKDFKMLSDRVQKEIDNGGLTEDRIDESVRKIIIKKIEMMYDDK